MSAIITNYASLMQAIIDNFEDDGSEFALYLESAIDLAEERLFKELDLPDMEIKVGGTLIPSQVTLVKPTGYRYANYLKIIVAGENLFLKKRRDDFLQDYWPNPTLTDVPKYYSDASATVFDLAPTPAAAYVYEVKYTQQPMKLSLTNTTNYFVDRCKDSLFLACMSEMARFTKSWSQVQIWDGQYSMIKSAWNLNMARVRRDDGQLPHNASAGPNDLQHTPSGKA